MEINNENKASKTSRKGVIALLFFVLGCIFLMFGYTTLAVPIKIRFEILIGLIVCGYILIIIASIFVMKNNNPKRHLDLGMTCGTAGGYLIFIYYQVSRIEGHNDNNRINKFYFDNAGIIKSTLLVPAFVFILLSVILIIYHVGKKARKVKSPISLD